jgi:hypothetical protein
MDCSLSNSNIESLKKEISKSRLTYSHLMDELIDHVCCDVEYEMRNGLPFAKAYERVKEKIGIGGLERIQHETLYLIDKKYRIMKNTMKISGVIAPILLAFASLFKIQHWPAASVLLVLGFIFLSFVFLPSAIYVNYKEVSNRTKKWMHLIGFLGSFLLSIGFLFKLQHWAGATMAIALGIVLIGLVFTPMVLFNKFHDKEVSVPGNIFIIALSGLMLSIIGILFKLNHWAGATMLLLLGNVLLILIAFPIYVVKTYKEEAHVTNSFIFLVIALVWFVVPISLISINTSVDVLKTTYKTSDYINMDLAFIEEGNAVLFAGMAANPKAVAIINKASELVDYIQGIKAEMVKLSNNDAAISASNEINVSGVMSSNPNGLYNMVVFGNVERGTRFKELLQKFEKEALAVSSADDYIAFVKGTTAYKIDREDSPSDDLLISINKLSFLQLNIRLAEQAALWQLEHPVQESTDKVQILTSK